MTKVEFVYLKQVVKSHEAILDFYKEDEKTDSRVLGYCQGIRAVLKDIKDLLEEINPA
ncbi:hypothetical protein [Sporomusa sphaeroides]|uniref:Uncharacterized protein n=1 Tax=Sporomusa sphaeroides DSM 2875 TaxID=1337886 RepID=A0A1U7M9Z0_9FIRM|nr:hypothetical protein [Sporomusa sphaeroides]OLS54323.1 hypothetical protein SPSPH_45690 [Sporomusa sphaeroides DSM 2875]CVK21552.1 hypothetical protein SSPH_04244 [Sporomusa sphaeroides DSM 2875]